MRTTPLLFAGALLAVVGLSGCELIGDIIQVGIWMGVVMILVVVGIIYWVWKKFSRRR